MSTRIQLLSLVLSFIALPASAADDTCVALCRDLSTSDERLACFRECRVVDQGALPEPPASSRTAPGAGSAGQRSPHDTGASRTDSPPPKRVAAAPSVAAKRSKNPKGPWGLFLNLEGNGAFASYEALIPSQSIDGGTEVTLAPALTVGLAWTSPKLIFAGGVNVNQLYGFGDGAPTLVEGRLETVYCGTGCADKWAFAIGAGAGLSGATSDPAIGSDLFFSFTNALGAATLTESGYWFIGTQFAFIQNIHEETGIEDNLGLDIAARSSHFSFGLQLKTVFRGF